MQPRKDELYTEQKKLGPHIKKFKKEIQKLDKILDSMSEAFKASKALREENKGELDLLE